MTEQQKMSPDWKCYLENIAPGTTIKTDKESFHVVRVLGAGNTAVTYEVLDEAGLTWALKVVDSASYGERAPFREVARFSAIGDTRFLVLPQQIGDLTLRQGDRERQFVWFKSRCVKGLSLEEFLAQSMEFSIEQEVKLFLTCVTVALEALAREGFYHGDLHSRNIIREVVGETSVSPQVRYVIIDFSEAYQRDTAGQGLSDDLEMLGQHLRRFSDVANQRETLTRGDQRILAAIAHLPGLLNGTSAAQTGVGSARMVYDRFNDALRASEQLRTELLSPFESLSTENLVNDALIADLCFTEMSWTSKLYESGNVLLVGPRGCGKTMLFRRMRLRTKLAAGRYDEIENDTYFGLYVPCESLFYMRFADLSQVSVDRNKAALVTYFNVCVAAEVAGTFSLDNKPFGEPTASFVAELAELLDEELGEIWDSCSPPGRVISMREILEVSQRALREIRKAIAFGRAAEPLGSTDFVARLVSLLRDQVPRLGRKQAIIFLDDYTEERVTWALQEALHPIVCQRAPDISFKISAHMFGSIYEQPRPLARDEGRNIEIINLGTMYMKRARGSEGELLLRILDKRFEHCPGYRGSVREWLGPTLYPKGWSLGRALNDTRTRQAVCYHGVECLKDLCTGDYSEMIRMAGEIFREAGIGPDQELREIDPKIQDKAIRRVALEYLVRVRHIRPDGQKLFDMVNAFGQMSATLLYDHPLVKQGVTADGSPRLEPHEMLNIYVDELTKVDERARNTWMRLQKASIFCDIGLAPSQHQVISDRATLRRIYCPAFGIGFASSENLQLTRRQFEWFIDEPYAFCKRRIKEVAGLRPPDLWAEALPGGRARSAELELWDSTALERGQEIVSEVDSRKRPTPDEELDFKKLATDAWKSFVAQMPAPQRLAARALAAESIDLFIAAMGFEERTYASAAALAEEGVRVRDVVMLEFDRYPSETETRRARFEEAISHIAPGKAPRPVLAPVNLKEDVFSGLFEERLGTLTFGKRIPRILFDTTSCPSLILAKALHVLLRRPCELTLLYAEAEQYFPTLQAMAPAGALGRGKPDEVSALSPIRGFDYFVAPPRLQAEDIEELPVLLVLFPTVSTERTDGVMSNVYPDESIWLFGKPEDGEEARRLTEILISFAAPLMRGTDKWGMVSRVDHRETLLALGGVFAARHATHRIAVMPHGSKMQTIGVSLFKLAHNLSLVFAMPKTYDPAEYSRGCKGVWGVSLGSTEELVREMRAHRVHPSFKPY